MISNLVTHLHLPAFFALKRIVCLLIAIAYYTVAERKIMAAIQRRRGPNVVGPGGLLQPIADGLKLVAKEMIIPGHANSHIFVVAPIAILTISLTGGTVLPFAYLATEHTFGNIPYNGSAELTARLGNRAFEEFPGTPDSHCNHGVFVPGEFLLDPEFQFEDGSIFSGATIDWRWKIFVWDLQETFELQYIYIQDNRDIVMSLGAGIPDVGMGGQRRAYYYAEKVCIAIFFWQAGKGPLLFYSMTRPRFAIFPSEISYKYCIAMAKTTMRAPLLIVCSGTIFMLAWCGAELQIHTFMAHAFYYGQLRLELQLVFNYYTPGMIQHLDQMLDGNTLPPTYFADRAFPGLLKVIPVTLIVFLIFLPFFVYYLFYHTDAFDARIRKKFNKYPPKRTGMVPPVLVIPPEYYKQEVVGEYKASRPPVKIERPPTEEEKEAFYAQLEIESAEHLGKLHAELARIKTIFAKTDYGKRNGLPGVWATIRKPQPSKLVTDSKAVIPPLKELNIVNLIIAGILVLTLLFVSTLPLQVEMLGTTYARFVGYIWWSAVGMALTAHYARDYPDERRKDFFMFGAGLLMVMGYRFFNSGDAAFGVPGMQQGGEIFVRYPNQRVMWAEYFDQYLSMEYLHIFLHAGDFPREGKGIRHDPSIVYIFFDHPDIPFVYLESPLHTACIPKHDLYPFRYR